jgi:hypothetical protein
MISASVCHHRTASKMINQQARNMSTDLVLQHVEKAAQGDPPLTVSKYMLGSSGATVDLAVAAEELIGFVVHIEGEPVDQLEALLATCARYLDRVVVVAAGDDAQALSGVDLAGAAVWAVDEAETLVELKAGQANRVGPAALLDLMCPQHHATLLRETIPADGPYDRTQLDIPSDRLRDHTMLGFAAPRQRYWSGLRAL